MPGEACPPLGSGWISRSWSARAGLKWLGVASRSNSAYLIRRILNWPAVIAKGKRRHLSVSLQAAGLTVGVRGWVGAIRALSSTGTTVAYMIDFDVDGVIPEKPSRSSTVLREGSQPKVRASLRLRGQPDPLAC